jgi:DNA polymerase/3'-5' exonuclease PolX
MILRHAQEAAREVVAQLRPLCRSIEVAGSVRRQAPEVRDLEIVCIPEVARYFEFQQLVNTWPRVRGQASGRYTRRKLLRHNLELDLFVCSAQTWACNILIRTGCADFSHALAVRANRLGLRFEGAQLWSGTRTTGVREEEEVFHLLGMPWVDPVDRTQEAARHILKRRGRGGWQ